MSTLPLLRLPESWPLPLVATLAMAALAGLDLLGAYAAKAWAEKGSTVALGIGVAAFLVLFYVYASALHYAELAVVTMGWIVLLQVGILVADRLFFGATLPAGKVVAVLVILLAQGYLILGPDGAPAPQQAVARPLDGATDAATTPATDPGAVLSRT